MMKEKKDTMRRGKKESSDSKCEKPWNTFWAYESLFYVTKSCNLHYVSL
jgi:hypothetical protein